MIAVINLAGMLSARRLVRQAQSFLARVTMGADSFEERAWLLTLANLAAAKAAENLEPFLGVDGPPGLRAMAAELHRSAAAVSNESADRTEAQAAYAGATVVQLRRRAPMVRGALPKMPARLRRARAANEAA